MFLNLRKMLRSVKTITIQYGHPPKEPVEEDPLEVYGRPLFLQLLTDDEVNASADHKIRPIIVPRDLKLLPIQAGYAECVNAGKSQWNEDQASFHRGVVKDPTHQYPDMPYLYFGIFDGHSTYKAACYVSRRLHELLNEKLNECYSIILHPDDEIPLHSISSLIDSVDSDIKIKKDDVITGTLESTFLDLDKELAPRKRLKVGGCTGCVALFINGKLYVANAGDSRAILCQRKHNEKPKATPLSFDHKPFMEKERLTFIGSHIFPRLKDHEKTSNFMLSLPENTEHPVFVRGSSMKGWCHARNTSGIWKGTVVMGNIKNSRLLKTLGVTRGFGDYQLISEWYQIPLKPFVWSQPDVTIVDLKTITTIPEENNEDGDYGVLVIGSDGLWDVLDNQVVAENVFNTLKQFSKENRRFTMVAQDLVAKARGNVNDLGQWQISRTTAPASVDDISVIIIPVYNYFKEYLEWKTQTENFQSQQSNETTSTCSEAEESLSLENALSHSPKDNHVNNVLETSIPSTIDKSKQLE